MTLGAEGDVDAGELVEEAGVVLAYCGVGLAMLLLGFVLIDLLTPGKLRDLIWVERNYNAAVLVATGFAAQGLIVVAAIYASSDDLVDGLVTTVVYSLIGLVVSAAAFLVVDLMIPGDVRHDLVHETPHPASWVLGVLRIVVSGIVALAII
ncbi:DUF350 domain-containing protein [Jiangella asiatica]|uniref:DUF350 domain-containing protein n=2 Tax=Jiangella asiatica TaxID=2530372 RepID=A0A4R5DUF7_9ACTN|nr:DUF350 domain-containing protein [Jiangella asiatica]